MESVTIKNTLAFLFPENAAQPAMVDMVRFVKALKGDHAKMETAYKIADEKSVFIRFKCEDAMKSVQENNEELLPFHYSNGKKVNVRMSVAGGNTRYVRIFDLPPEISDLDISLVMEKYGTVKRTIRERFPAEYNLNMYTGVRGLYMDIQREIPEVLFFRNRKGRIFYDGIKSRCYLCKSDEHLKKSCPILQARREREVAQEQSVEECQPETLTDAVEKKVKKPQLPWQLLCQSRVIGSKIKYLQKTMRYSRQSDSGQSTQTLQAAWHTKESTLMVLLVKVKAA